jgi:hypothetical protein
MKTKALFLTLILLATTVACSRVAQTRPTEDASSPTPQTTSQVDIRKLMERLCMDEGGARGVRCSTFYFIDATIPGWQEFINAILQTYYGLPAQEYVKLVTYVGSTFVPQTYGDRLTPVFAQQASILADQGAAVCFPVAESESAIALPAGCNAVAVLIPQAGALSVDGASVFPRGKYMSESFGHPQSITTGIPEDIMRMVLESFFP